MWIKIVLKNVFSFWFVFTVYLKSFADIHRCDQLRCCPNHRACCHGNRCCGINRFGCVYLIIIKYHKLFYNFIMLFFFVEVYLHIIAEHDYILLETGFSWKKMHLIYYINTRKPYPLVIKFRAELKICITGEGKRIFYLMNYDLPN